jgi:hypothetical protein
VQWYRQNRRWWAPLLARTGGRDARAAGLGGAAAGLDEDPGELGRSPSVGSASVGSASVGLAGGAGELDGAASVGPAR